MFEQKVSPIDFTLMLLAIAGFVFGVSRLIVGEDVRAIAWFLGSAILFQYASLGYKR